MQYFLSTFFVVWALRGSLNDPLSLWERVRVRESLSLAWIPLDVSHHERTYRINHI